MSPKPAPIAAPAIGPPTTDVSNPTEFGNTMDFIAPSAAPPIIVDLFLPIKSWAFLEMNPPILSFPPLPSSTSGPNNQSLNLSDLDNNPPANPITAPPTGPPISAPSNEPPLIAPKIAPDPTPTNASGNASTTFFLISAMSFL